MYQNQDGDAGHCESLSTSCPRVLQLWIEFEQPPVNGKVHRLPSAMHPDDGGCCIDRTPSLELGQGLHPVCDSFESTALSHPLKCRYRIVFIYQCLECGLLLAFRAVIRHKAYIQVTSENSDDELFH